MCFANNGIDLPSLTNIQGDGDEMHKYMGYVILESMIWFDLIWLDIPNLTKNNIHYGNAPFKYTADLQATSTFHFIIIFMFKMLLLSKMSFEKPRNIGMRIMILILFLIQILIGKTRNITATIEQSENIA